MLRMGRRDRDRLTALWLFFVAFLVFAMVVVGGATRLTGSGLSITEWKPILGAIPPMTASDWAAAFEKYRAIPQYQHVNAGMTLQEFKGIFWWEWAHRFLGRFIGLAFGLPFLVLVLMKRIPGRLIGRCLVLLGLGALQGLIGWWMVASGLVERVDVAPERLAIHLGLALLIFMMLVWTGLEAWNGPAPERPATGWSRAAWALLIGVFLQCLLGALVAGGKAGFVYTDWPLMNGQLLAPVNASLGLLAVLHDQALTQFNHRLGAYALLLGALAYAVMAQRRGRLRGPTLTASRTVLGLVVLQALLGIATLMHAVPLALGVAHQAMAVIVLLSATINLWLVLRMPFGLRRGSF